MDNVPGMMSEFSKALGSFTQQQMVAYMQFTEAREQLNEYEKQLSEAKTQYEAAKEKALASADVTKQLDIKTLATLIYAQNFSMLVLMIAHAVESFSMLQQSAHFPLSYVVCRTH
jgi:HAE1 family hydrophobic/amphiphilic exporter-1